MPQLPGQSLPGATLGNTNLWGGPIAGNGNVLVGDIIYHALRIAGVLQMPGRGYSVWDYNDAFWELNQMLSTWQAQQNLVYAYPRTVFSINIGQGGPGFPYLVGTTPVNGVMPDIVIPRPERIEWASYMFTNVNPIIEEAFQMLTAQEYAALSPKNLQSGNPTMAYYEPTVPNGSLFMYPIPTDSYVTQGALYTWQSVGQFQAVTDAVITPPSYIDAMTYNLGVRIAARWGPRANLSPLSVALAAKALNVIKSLNMLPYLSQCERGSQAVGQSRGNWNILSNQYV